MNDDIRRRFVHPLLSERKVSASAKRVIKAVRDAIDQAVASEDGIEGFELVAAVAFALGNVAVQVETQIGHPDLLKATIEFALVQGDESQRAYLERLSNTK